MEGIGFRLQVHPTPGPVSNLHPRFELREPHLALHQLLLVAQPLLAASKGLLKGFLRLF